MGWNASAYILPLPGAELREIQKQINNLPDMYEPEIVGDFLALRRDVMFLEIDTAVRHSMIDTFLHTGNVQAFKVIVRAKCSCKLVCAWSRSPGKSGWEIWKICLTNVDNYTFLHRYIEWLLWLIWTARMAIESLFQINKEIIQCQSWT